MVLDEILSEERAQGATEYLLMLSAALIVVGSIIALTFTAFDGLSSSVENQIKNTEKELMNELT